MKQVTLTLVEGLPHHLFHPHAPPISPPVRTWRMEILGLSGIFSVVDQPVHVGTTDLVLHGIVFWCTAVDGCSTASGISEHHNGGFHRDVVHKHDGLYRCRLRGITSPPDPLDPLHERLYGPRHTRNLQGRVGPNHQAVLLGKNRAWSQRCRDCSLKFRRN